MVVEVSREDVYYEQIVQAIVFYKSSSRRFSVHDISILTGLSEEHILELMELKTRVAIPNKG